MHFFQYFLHGVVLKRNYDLLQFLEKMGLVLGSSHVFLFQEEIYSLTEKLKVARGVSGRDMRSTVGERSVWVPLVHSDGGSTRKTTETRRGGNYVSSPKTVFNCNAISSQF